MAIHQKEKKCTNCGEMYTDGSKFCPMCSHEISSISKTTQYVICLIVVGCIIITGIYVFILNKKQEFVGITVNISPVIDEAVWKINTVSDYWKISGETLNVEAGQEYTIMFKTINGWIPPEDRIVFPQSDNPIDINAIYRRKKIGITVRLKPDEVTRKARWKIENISSWKLSGESVSVETGRNYEIIYNKFDKKWIPPRNTPVICQGDNDIPINESYIFNDDIVVTATKKEPEPVLMNQLFETSITVIIEPPEVRNLGAKWEIKGLGKQDSGNTIEIMIPTKYSVFFAELPGWQKPGKIDILVKKGQKLRKIGTYIKN